MIVQVPLHTDLLEGNPSLTDVHAALSAHYAGQGIVTVVPLEESSALARLDPEELNGTDRMEIFVFGAAGTEQVNVAARLDNLGKGASGAAVQNLNLMLGLSG
jgi:N-acetyl-gamma-glutamyl-phosphate reductase